MDASSLGFPFPALLELARPESESIKGDFEDGKLSSKSLEASSQEFEILF